MSAYIQVVVAVSAVVSAFHGGAELAKQIKKKRKGKKQAEQALKEKDLQESLEDGQHAVQQRYFAEYQELGQRFRTGDAIAQNRLLNIAVMMQAEIIRSLQLAVQYETAILNLNVLRDASVLNRQDTLTTLGELRRRILAEPPIERPFATLQVPEIRRAPSMESIRTFMTAQIEPEFVPPAVTIIAEPEARGGLGRLLSSRRPSTARNALPNAPSQLSFIPTFEWLRPMIQLCEQPDSSFEKAVFGQLGLLQIESQPQDLTGPARNSSISAGSTDSNSNPSDRVPSITSINETTSNPSPLSTSAPSPPALGSPTSPNGLSPNPTLTGSDPFQRPPHTHPSPYAGDTIAMDLRPSKQNNFFGFCKGAWLTRASLGKGLQIQTRRYSYCSDVSVWACRECSFQSEAYAREPAAVNPAVYAVPCGLRYRWIFLAKSHVPVESHTQAQAGDRRRGGGANYGCMFCCAEGRVSGIYGSVETLMNHIYVTHGRTMSAEMQARTRCVFNRLAKPREEFDLNIPRALEAAHTFELPVDSGLGVPVPLPLN